MQKATTTENGINTNGFAPFVEGEPVFIFRAKDNFSDVPVIEYLKALVDSDGCTGVRKSAAEFLNLREEWRAKHPELCKDPDA